MLRSIRSSPRRCNFCSVSLLHFSPHYFSSNQFSWSMTFKVPIQTRSHGLIPYHEIFDLLQQTGPQPTVPDLVSTGRHSLCPENILLPDAQAMRSRRGRRLWALGLQRNLGGCFSAVSLPLRVCTAYDRAGYDRSGVSVWGGFFLCSLL